jgi:copper chaperone
MPTSFETNNSINNPFLTGVKSYDVSLDKQTAEITADESLDYATVLEKIKKTGKTIKGAEVDGKAQAFE